MQAKIETLKAKNANDEEYLVYPRTLIKCVVDENGNTIEDKLTDFVEVEFGDTFATVQSVSDIVDGTTVVAEANKSTFDSDDNNIAETFSNIIDGTTQVGNAKTLGGHGAEYFAPLEKLSNFTPTLYEVNSETEYDELLTNLQNNAKDNEWYRCIINPKVMHSILGSSAYYVEGVRRIDGYGYQRLTSFTQGYGLACFERSMYGGTWGKWVNPLTTAGGTITTNSNNRLPQLPLELVNGVNENGSVIRFADQKGALGHLGFTEKDLPIFSDVNGVVKQLLHSGNFGDYALPLDGSKPITGNIFRWMNGYGGLSASNIHAAIASWIDNNNMAGDGSAIVLYNGNVSDIEEARRLRYQVIKNGVHNWYELLHTGNKPSGTYTGNGDATQRTVNVGGIAGLVLIAYGDTMAIVSMGGTIVKSGSTITALNKTEAQFDPNTKNIILNTARVELNASNATYTYWSI